MAINYFSINIITNDLSENIFSGIFGVDIGSNQIIKFFNNINTNVNILNTDSENSNNANWLFINNRFSENGTIIVNIPLLNIIGAQKFKIYTSNNNINHIDYYNGTWNTIQNTYMFSITFLTSTEVITRPRMRIDQYCALQQRRSLTRMGGCIPALPLSKKGIYANANGNANAKININNSGVFSCPNLKNKMRYAEYVRIYGGTQKSVGSFKKICTIAGPTFSY